jgi:hypothetical protein
MKLIDPSLLFDFDRNDEDTSNSELDELAEQVNEAYEKAGRDLLKLAESDESIDIEWTYTKVHVA